MSELPAIDAERPWPGLLPFTEDTQMFFHGREAEADELFRLIEREPLTVLFGQSGLGKSSLLNAGVFPRLRRAGYLPVYLRLTLDAAAPALIEQVWQALLGECTKNDATASPLQPGDSFWEYLHRPGTQFLNPHGRPVMPVLAFDQFEEIFTLGRQTPRQTARTEAFLDQLGELIENRLPPSLESQLTEHPERLDQIDLLRQNVKILFAFREDYLADFEGLKGRIRPIMQNRMRLTRMRGDCAAEAIQASGAGRLSAPVAGRIVRYVAGAAGNEAGRLEDLSVEPALLSLVCRGLNEQRIARRQPEITADLIQGENTQQIIAAFYTEGFAGLDVRVRYFVEDRLLTTEGHRDSCALDNALAEPGVSEAAIQTLVDRRILRREDRAGQVRLELIHDVLTGVAVASRDARREELALAAAQQQLARQRRRQRTIVACAAILVAGLAGVSWLAVVANREKVAANREAAAEREALHKAEQERQRADKQQKVAQNQTARAVEAEKLAVSKQRQANIGFAAAYEQLDTHGTVEQTRACIDSSRRLSAEPPPPVTREYMVGLWHVEEGGSLTYTDWRADGTCVNKHIYENGNELQLAGDRCQWRFQQTGNYEFTVDWTSTALGADYPKHLPFKIVSPVQIHNTQMNYDAYRVICPAGELAIHRRGLALLQQRAAANPSNNEYQGDVAQGIDKLAQVLQSQGHPAQAEPEFVKQVDFFQQLAQRDPANPAWQRGLIWAYVRLGDNRQVLEQHERARDAYQQALAVDARLLGGGHDDNDVFRSAFVSEGLGKSLKSLGPANRAASREAFQRAARQFQGLAEKYPKNAQVKQNLSVCYYLLSTASDAEEAKLALQKALATAEELQREHKLPEESARLPDFLRLELAKVH